MSQCPYPLPSPLPFLFTQFSFPPNPPFLPVKGFRQRCKYPATFRQNPADKLSTLNQAHSVTKILTMKHVNPYIVELADTL